MISTTGLMLETNRLFLRDFQQDDVKAVHEYAGDPRVAEHSSWGPLSLDETRKYVEAALNEQLNPIRQVFELGVVRKVDNRLIGTACFKVRSSINLEGEIGFTLRLDAWGQGYATEAARELIRFGFEKHRMHRLIAAASPLNIASQRVLEKVGMKREGHLRQNILQRGKWRDSILFSILADELVAEEGFDFRNGAANGI